MNDRVKRVEVRRGYDLWSKIYEERGSTLVGLDRRHTLRHLNPQEGERILDAGCGTGAHLRDLVASGAHPVGLDFSAGMLAVARRSDPRLSLLQADLNHPMPLQGHVFDAVLCTLVSEHLASLSLFFEGVFGLLAQEGRLIFSAFRPAMAAAGVEANFEIEGTEYRLGAELHTLEDYLEGMQQVGFRDIEWWEYEVDSDLVSEIPSAAKHLGEPLLLMIEAVRKG